VDNKTILLLFTNKPSVHPVVKTVAIIFQKQIVIGVVEEKQKNLMKRFKVQKVPQLS